MLFEGIKFVESCYSTLRKLNIVSKAIELLIPEIHEIEQAVVQKRAFLDIRLAF